MKAKKIRFRRIKAFIARRAEKRDIEYAKRMLTRIINNSIVMMYLSYVLAWSDKVEIAEQLSITVATVIIGVAVPYLVTKTIENINKYGSRLNHTTAEKTNEEQAEHSPALPKRNKNKHRDC